MGIREIKFRAWDKINKKMLSWEEICEERLISDILTFPLQYIPLQFTGLKDSEGNEIYTDYLLKYIIKKEEIICRVYVIKGGFAIKDSVWAKDTKDLIPSDILITTPLGDAQTQSWIENNCKVLGNIYEGLKIDL